VCKTVRQNKTDVLDVCWCVLSRDKLGRKAQNLLRIKRSVFWVHRGFVCGVHSVEDRKVCGVVSLRCMQD
jgi:hypothetical protein